MSTRAAATKKLNAGLLERFPAQDRTVAACRASRREVGSLMCMLVMLLENGLSLQKALEALSLDRSCRKHRVMLSNLRMRVVAGESLSKAMLACPSVFSATMVHHIALAESSGTLIESLQRIAKNIEESLELQRTLIQKLSYPAVVMVAGAGLITFMLVSVVPQFEQIYSESDVALPWVTSVVTALSRFASRFLWLVPLAMVCAYFAWRSVRSNPTSLLALDKLLLTVPVLKNLLLDLSAIEYLRSALVLSEAGFVPLDAISQAAKSVPNRYARQLLAQVASDVQRGQKISVALRKCEFLFPNSVMQLIAVGEQTGGLTQACLGASRLVKRRLENRISAALGILEPALTVSLAICVGWIVLAIYMPMFGMFDVLEF